MVKPIILAVGAIPAIIAILIAIPLLTQPEIPYSAANPNDRIEVEYTKYQLKKISFGVTDRTGSQKTEILLIKNNGDLRYTLTEDGIPQPDIEGALDQAKLKKITALIKETGFITIPSESFPIKDGVNEYSKSTLKITLNDVTKQIHWPEQNATEKFIPPIITMVELELDQVIQDISE
jgi:hypothetical protein